MENIQKMLLAVEVRKLAQDIRAANRQANINAIRKEIGDDRAKLDELDAKWGAENPIENFLEPAYDRIASVADRLDGLERARVQKSLEGNRYAQAAQQPPLATFSGKVRPSE
ncbi:hypothetical protein [Massilia varians]|uniref:hypothetical protein n=1 Tax=Massilia varians TaxID=457921 RepID=UPI0025536D36|nr:hypothetical protein [Massilia varians]MDK6077929.1 hypothetical protein [Massilia varians]